MNEALQESIMPLVMVIAAASASGIVVDGLVWAISLGINALIHLIGVKNDIVMINGGYFGSGGGIQGGQW